MFHLGHPTQEDGAIKFAHVSLQKVMPLIFIVKGLMMDFSEESVRALIFIAHNFIGWSQMLEKI